MLLLSADETFRPDVCRLRRMEKECRVTDNSDEARTQSGAVQVTRPPSRDIVLLLSADETFRPDVCRLRRMEKECRVTKE